jgi:ATP-dependent helicase/nuclease subunit B
MMEVTEGWFVPRSFFSYHARTMPVILRHEAAAGAPLPEERINGGAFGTFLVIVPTNRRVRHLTRELVTRMPGGVGTHPNLHTLETLARTMFGEMYPRTRVVRGVTQALLYRKAVQTAGPLFRYFTLRSGAFPLQRGTFDTVTAVINRQKETGVTPDVLADELAIAEPDELQKLADVIEISRAYETALASADWTDVPGIFLTLSRGCTQQQFEAAFRTVYPDVDMVAVAGFDEFSEPELGFLWKIVNVSGLSIDLTFDFQPGNTGLFGHLEENYTRLRELGLEEPKGRQEHAWPDLVLGRESRSVPAGDGIGLLGARLFSLQSHADRVSFRDQVTVVRARDRVQEVEVVCRMIKRMVEAEPALDLSKVCVAMYLQAPYTPIIGRMFARYEIPVNITDRFELARSPLIVTLFGLLQIVARGFRREDVLRVADAPYTTLVPGKERSGHLLAEVSGRLKITAGYQAWTGRIRAALAQPQSEAQRPQLEAALAQIETLHEVLKPFAQELTPAGFEREIRLLIDRLRMRENLLGPGPSADPSHRERDVRAYARLLDVLTELTEAMTSTEGPVPRPLAFHLEALHAAVSAQLYNVREQFGKGVLVTAIEETRGLAMDAMFVIGLVDGEFPRVYQPEVFYSLERQKERALRYAWEQRYLFYQAVTNWARRLVLTYPEQDGEIELVRSSFVDAFLETADVSVTSGETAAAHEEILSVPELLRYGAVSPEGVAKLLPEIPPDVRRRVDAVVRSVGVEMSRLETHALPAYEGIIGGSLPEERMASLRALRDRVFSVSQLESYGTCPFQFFGTRVLRLRPPEEFREDLSPIERGFLLHAILFDFMTDRRARRLPDLWRCTGEQVEAAKHDLLALARARLDGVDLPDPFWEADRDALLGTGGRPGLLQEFLDVEHERSIPLEARFFEVAFGPGMWGGTPHDTELSTDEAVMVGDVKLRGRVDRVEIGDGVFVIIDYKTGKHRIRLADIREGTSLQLPLYLQAVEQLLASRTHLRAIPAAGLHYHLADRVTLEPVLASKERQGVAYSADSRSRQTVATDRELREVIDASVARAGAYVAAMSEGVFPVTTPDRIARFCRVCGTKTVCRIQAAYYIPPDQGDPS